MIKAFGRDFASYQIPLAVEQRFGIESTISRAFTNYPHLIGSFGIGIENVHVKKATHHKLQTFMQRTIFLYLNVQNNCREDCS